MDADNRLAVRREFIEILDVGQEQIPAVVASRLRHFVLLLVVLRNSTRPHPETNIERFSNTFGLRIVTSSSPLIVHAIFIDVTGAVFRCRVIFFVIVRLYAAREILTEVE